MPTRSRDAECAGILSRTNKIGAALSVENETNDASWLEIAKRPDIVKRSAKVAFLVGTILVAINQGNLLLNGTMTADLYWKIPLTYCVPYAVSTYAAVDAIFSRQ